jgi:hypothetical protein
VYGAEVRYHLFVPPSPDTLLVLASFEFEAERGKVPSARCMFGICNCGSRGPRNASAVQYSVVWFGCYSVSAGMLKWMMGRASADGAALVLA